MCSGLVREHDIAALNKCESNAVANQMQMEQGGEEQPPLQEAVG